MRVQRSRKNQILWDLTRHEFKHRYSCFLVAAVAAAIVKRNMNGRQGRYASGWTDQCWGRVGGFGVGRDNVSMFRRTTVSWWLYRLLVRSCGIDVVPRTQPERRELRWVDMRRVDSCQILATKLIRTGRVVGYKTTVSTENKQLSHIV